MKKLTGTTGANQGDTTTIAHGLTGTKIISVTAKVANIAGWGITPECSYDVNIQYALIHDTLNVYIRLKSGNSGAILNKAITVLITYEE
jgi:hypothetical protein